MMEVKPSARAESSSTRTVASRSRSSRGSEGTKAARYSASAWQGRGRGRGAPCLSPTRPRRPSLRRPTPQPAACKTASTLALPAVRPLGSQGPNRLQQGRRNLNVSGTSRHTGRGRTRGFGRRTGRRRKPTICALVPSATISSPMRRSGRVRGNPTLTPDKGAHPHGHRNEVAPPRAVG